MRYDSCKVSRRNALHIKIVIDKEARDGLSAVAELLVHKNCHCVRSTFVLCLFLFCLLLFVASTLDSVISCLCMMSLALNSSDFNNHANRDNWCASICRQYGRPALYENVWTDNQHYVCQYNCEYSTLYIWVFLTIMCTILPRIWLRTFSWGLKNSHARRRRVKRSICLFSVNFGRLLFCGQDRYIPIRCNTMRLKFNCANIVERSLQN